MRQLTRGKAGGFKTVRSRMPITNLPSTRRVYRTYKPPQNLNFARAAAAAHKAVTRQVAHTEGTGLRNAPHVIATGPHRNVHAPNGPKAHGGNTNPPGNAKSTNQSYGPPSPVDAAPPATDPFQDLDPTTYANTQGDVQFGGDIADLENQLKNLQAAGPQKLADIDAAYGKVEAAQAAAAGENATAGANAAASQENFVKGLVASLGGAANQGSGGVASAGVDSVALMRNLGTIQSGTDADLGVALRAEQADQRVNQGRIDSAAARDLAQQIAGLRGQRGAAVASARLDAIKYNNDVAQSRLDAKTQAFQNKIAAQNAIIAARAAGDQHLAAQLQNAYALANPTDAFGRYAGKGTSKPMTAGQTANAVNRAVQQATKSLLIRQPQTIRREDGSIVTNPHAGQMVLDPRYQHNVKALVTAVNSAFAGLHSTNKAALAARNRLLRQYGVTPQPGWNF